MVDYGETAVLNTSRSIMITILLMAKPPIARSSNSALKAASRSGLNA